MKSEIWIGLVGVVPVEGNETLGKGIGGAYLIALGYALDCDDFEKRLKNKFESMGYEIIEIEDIEPYSERIKKYEVDSEITTLAQEVGATKEIRLGIYHTFPSKGANYD